MLWPKLARRLASRPLTDSTPEPPSDVVQALAARLEATARARLGRSLAIREVDAGSCNGCELEANAMAGVLYDLERFGLRFVASPRHADVLLVTGPVAKNMETAVKRAYDATPEPKLVVAVGDCGCTGGIFGESYASCGRVSNVIPVDVAVPGCPPTPLQLMQGILAAIAPGKSADGEQE